MAVKKTLIAEWTREVTASRMAIWRAARAAAGPAGWTDRAAHELEKRLGWTASDLNHAFLYYLHDRPV